MHARRLASRFAVARLTRSLVVPLAIALPPLLWVADATKRASVTPLGRDQGIFQYIAWALSWGQKDYRDIRDVNGPLTHLVHRVLLALGGADEHRFRILDLVITGATFAIVGACLPGLRSRRAPEALDRAAWAVAAWVVLSGQYLLYGYWDIAQRESFFDWFMLPSVALQLVAQRSLVRGRSMRLLALVGALSVIPCFGKPTYALFTVAQLLAVALDDDLGALRRKALRAFLCPSSPSSSRPATRSPTPASSSATCPRCTASSGRAPPRTSSPTRGAPRRPSTASWAPSSCCRSS
jgi:hypothetical protein